MNPLFKDKIARIEKLMAIILDNFITNFSYPDVEGFLDELPFSQLFLSLKKKIYESLIDLYVKNENGNVNEILNELQEYEVYIKDGHLVYPTIGYFKSNDVEYCMVNLEKYKSYTEKLESCIFDSPTYIYAVKRLYCSLEFAGGSEKYMNGILKDKDAIECRFQESMEEDTAYFGSDGIDNYWDIEIDEGSWQYNFLEEVCLAFGDAMWSGKKSKPKSPRLRCADNEILEIKETIIYDKRLFLDSVLSDGKNDSEIELKEIRISGYTTFLETIIDALTYKEYYNIPDETVMDILDDVYNRMLKTAIITTINLHTRKKDALIKKASLKEEIRKSHSIGTDRWNNCMALYSDTVFKIEDLNVMANFIPQISKIIELI